MKPSRRGQTWLPLAMPAVAARLNSPTAKQILDRKLRKSMDILSLGLSRAQMLLHTAHSMRPLEAIPNRLNRLRTTIRDGEQGM